MSTDEWRIIPGFSRYEISTDGVVRRRVGCRRAPAGYVISTQLNIHGYVMVGLMGDDGKIYARSLHVVLLLAHRGERPDGMEARHLNGVRTDNRLDNLVWGTKMENAADRIAHGNQVRGSAVNTSRLTADQVREIRRINAEEGIGDYRLSRRYGVARNAIRMILLRRTWAHI